MLEGEHSAIRLTFIKLPFVIKMFVLSIFEWPLKTGFILLYLYQCMRFCKFLAVCYSTSSNMKNGIG